MLDWNCRVQNYRRRNPWFDPGKVGVSPGPRCELLSDWFMARHLGCDWSLRRSSCWHHLTPNLLPSIMTPHLLRYYKMFSGHNNYAEIWDWVRGSFCFLTCQIFLSISEINWIHWLVRIFFILIYHIKLWAPGKQICQLLIPLCGD